jgi:hypothetical protein
VTAPLLLSYSKAAKLLGVSRNKALHELIAAGVLRPVLLLGRSFIPREQIEALGRHGDTPQATPAPKPKKGRGGSIGDLKLF